MKAPCPCLWFNDGIEEKVDFYISIFPNSRVVRSLISQVDTPGAKKGEVVLIDFELKGRPFQALNGGPGEGFNDAISLSVSCRDQEEVDQIWSTFLESGGREVCCGWIKDKYGVSWQIVPEELMEMMADPDAEKATRVTNEMHQQIKLDVAKLKKAFDGI